MVIGLYTKRTCDVVAASSGRTAASACCWGYVDAARLLLDNDRALKDGATPLHVACEAATAAPRGAELIGRMRTV